jgi:hypothetical protein
MSELYQRDIKYLISENTRSWREWYYEAAVESTPSLAGHDNSLKMDNGYENWHGDSSVCSIGISQSCRLLET